MPTPPSPSLHSPVLIRICGHVFGFSFFFHSFLQSMSMTFFLPVFPSQRNELAKKKRISLWVLLTGHVRMTNRNQEKQKLKKHKKKKKKGCGYNGCCGCSAGGDKTERTASAPAQATLRIAPQRVRWCLPSSCF